VGNIGKLHCLNLEDGAARLYRNVGNYQSAVRNIPGKRRSRRDACCGGGEKRTSSRKMWRGSNDGVYVSGFTRLGCRERKIQTVL
jgi:hypothetical protein